MDTIKLTSPVSFVINDVISTLSKKWKLMPSIPGSVVVSDKSDRVYLHFESELDDCGKYSLLIDYSSIELAKEILLTIADSPTITVHNDCGTVASGDQFVALCKSRTSWDWRQDNVFIDNDDNDAR